MNVRGKILNAPLLQDCAKSGRVAKLVYARGLGPRGAIRGGSSPLPPTLVRIYFGVTSQSTNESYFEPIQPNGVLSARLRSGVLLFAPPPETKLISRVNSVRVPKG